MYKKLIFFLGFAVILAAINLQWISPVLTPILGVETSAIIVSALEKNAQGLLVSFLIAFYVTVIEKRISEEKDDAAGFESADIKKIFVTISKKLNTKKVIELLLSSEINKDFDKGEIEDLVDVILPNKNCYYDVKINYILKDTIPLSDSYNLQYEIEFKASIEEYVIAIASNGFVQELISSSCSKVSDVFTVGTIAKDADYLANLLNNVSIQKISKDTSSKTVQSLLPKLIVKDKDYYKYLSLDLKEFHKDIILIRADCGRDANKLCSYFVSMPALVCKKDAHFVYWIADRPMWVEYINFDASSFSFNGAQSFSIQSVLINYIDRKSKQCNNKGAHIKVNSWIVKGHGAIFSWR